jgi:hypothetical protein
MENTVLAEALPARVFAGFQKWSFVVPVVYRYARLARIARGVWVFGLPDIDPPAIAGVNWVSLTGDTPSPANGSWSSTPAGTSPRSPPRS